MSTAFDVAVSSSMVRKHMPFAEPGRWRTITWPDTKRGREIYRRRKWIGEPPCSWIKSAMGFDRFHLRGLTKVTSEWDLACLAANLRRMHRKVVFG